jgi:transglutaminase/protease-like cytokinesis protein 3
MKILKKQNKPPKDIVMLFDKTMVLFFGDKAYQTAGQATTPKYRSQWIKRVLKWVMKTVDKIETAPRQKQLLMANVESAYKSVGNTDQQQRGHHTHSVLLAIGLTAVHFRRIRGD